MQNVSRLGLILTSVIFIFLINVILLPVLAKDKKVSTKQEILLGKVESNNKKLTEQLSKTSYSSYLKNQIESTIKEYKKRVFELTRATLDGKLDQVKSISKRIAYLKYWLGNLKNQLRIKNVEIQELYKEAQKDADKLRYLTGLPVPGESLNSDSVDAIEKRKKIRAQIDYLQKLKERVEKFTVKPAKKSSDKNKKTNKETKKKAKENGDTISGHPQDRLSADSFAELAELIRTTVSGDSPAPGTVSKADKENLELIIKNSEDVQKRIKELLEKLRQLQDTRIIIEVKFITISDQFFEKIGVDFDFITENEYKKSSGKDKVKVEKKKGSSPAPANISDDLDFSFFKSQDGTVDSATRFIRSVDSGKLEFGLSGDSHTTSSVLCTFTNKTNEDISIHLVPGSLFLPAIDEYQTMMVTKEKHIIVPGRKSLEKNVETFCVSSKNVKPPPSKEKKIVYSPGYHEDLRVHAQLVAILATSLEFGAGEAYSSLMIPEKNRTHTIGQLAVWKQLGEKTTKVEDDVTSKSIRDDIMKKSGNTFAALTPAQKRGVDEGVAQIFQAVDLTQKTSNGESATQKNRVTL